MLKKTKFMMAGGALIAAMAIGLPVAYAASGESEGAAAPVVVTAVSSDSDAITEAGADSAEQASEAGQAGQGLRDCSCGKCADGERPLDGTGARRGASGQAGTGQGACQGDCDGTGAGQGQNRRAGNGEGMRLRDGSGAGMGPEAGSGRGAGAGTGAGNPDCPRR